MSKFKRAFIVCAMGLCMFASAVAVGIIFAEYQNRVIEPIPNVLLRAGDRYMVMSPAEKKAEMKRIEAEKTPNYSALTDILKLQISEYQGDWSLYFEDISRGQVIVLNSHQVYSASLIKLFVAQAVYNEIAAGTMDNTAAVNEEISRMITYSDNNAWQSLARRLGGGSYMYGMERVTEIAADEGYTESGQFMKGDKRNFNFTSVSDCGMFLHRLLNGEVVSAEYSQKLLDLLKQQEVLHKIPAGVPDGIETANKTGELEYIEGDAAIVYAPSGTYILVIIADSLDDADLAQPQIRDVSETVYNFLNDKEF